MSPTTIVLILVLLGAVAGASRLVSPPPPEPPKPAPATKINTADTQKIEKARMDHYREEMKKQAAALKNPAAAAKPITDPNTIEINNDYFRTHKPGEAGIAQVDKDFQERTEKFHAYLKQTEEANKKNPTKGQEPAAPQIMTRGPVK